MQRYKKFSLLYLPLLKRRGEKEININKREKYNNNIFPNYIRGKVITFPRTSYRGKRMLRIRPVSVGGLNINKPPTTPSTQAQTLKPNQDENRRTAKAMRLFSSWIGFSNA